MNDASVATLDEVVYPESDGQPMADNTLQWDWMVKIVEELRLMFAGQQVFVAGNLFWYPVEGAPSTVSAPDAMVAFGRPPGHRGSYKQWQEGGVAPQVVFEVLSPRNTTAEMQEKLNWYDRYGVEEYYFIDPYDHKLEGWIRRGGRLKSVADMNGFESPRLKIRFRVHGEVKLLTPDGRVFKTREESQGEMEARAEEATQQAQEAAAEAEHERIRAQEAIRQAQEAAAESKQERIRAQEAIRRSELLAAKLRELGVNPDDLSSANP